MLKIDDAATRKLLRWALKGARGASSSCMAAHLSGIGARDDVEAHPYDPDDFDRCLQLLEAVPELRPLIPEMANLSKEWKALVDNWGEIEASHLEEVGLGWTKSRNAPTKTYALMKKVLGR